MSGRRKLRAEDIPFIRASTETIEDLAKRFGVTASNISHVRTGRSWKSVPLDDIPDLTAHGLSIIGHLDIDGHRAPIYSSLQNKIEGSKK